MGTECVYPYHGWEIQIPLFFWHGTSWNHHQISRSFILLLDSVLIFYLPFVCVSCKFIQIYFFSSSFSFFQWYIFCGIISNVFNNGQTQRIFSLVLDYVTMWPAPKCIYEKKKRKWKSYIDSRRYTIKQCKVRRVVCGIKM